MSARIGAWVTCLCLLAGCAPFGHGCGHSGAAHSHPTQQESRESRPAVAPTPAARYVCPMHPAIVASFPGKCPECGMSLVREGGS